MSSANSFSFFFLLFCFQHNTSHIHMCLITFFFNKQPTWVMHAQKYSTTPSCLPLIRSWGCLATHHSLGITRFEVGIEAKPWMPSTSRQASLGSTKTVHDKKSRVKWKWKWSGRLIDGWLGTKKTKFGGSCDKKRESCSVVKRQKRVIVCSQTHHQPTWTSCHVEELRS